MLIQNMHVFKVAIFFPVKITKRNSTERKIDKTRTSADQHKCLLHLACISPTLLCVEYFLVYGH